MDLSRRELLALIASMPVSAMALTDSEAELLTVRRRPHGANMNAFSVLQGMTDATSAQFSVVVAKDETLSFAIEPLQADESSPQLSVQISLSVKRHQPATASYGVYKICATGLALGQLYELKMLSQSGAVLDRREFSTLDLTSSTARIAMLSCAFDGLHRSDIWAHLEAQRPDIIFFLGDSVYADRNSVLSFKGAADPEKLWRRYSESRQRVSLYYWKRLVPVMAVWDDHDFGDNNSGSWYPHKHYAKYVFETFFAQDATVSGGSLLAGPGVARRLSAFGMDFLFLDGRTFREQPNVAGSYLFGQEQIEWAFNHFQGRPTLILSGSLFFGEYAGRESFEGYYRQDFAEFLARLRKIEAPVAFASGDVHYSELMDIEESQLGYRTFEIVSSSMHSYTFPGHHLRTSNPRRREVTSHHNFVILETTSSNGIVDAEVNCFNANGLRFAGAVHLSR